MRKIKVRKYNNPQRPHLRFVVGFRQSGKRSQKFFETKEEANSFADFKNAERKQNGLTHAEFPEKLRNMAQEAVEALRPFGKTIRDAVQHYVAHLKASEKSCTAEQLVKELLKAKEADGVGKRHLDDLRNRLGVREKKNDEISPTSFAAMFEGKLVAEITSAEIDDWLRSLEVGPQTRNHYRANVLQAFNFAVRHGYAPTNPVEGAAKAKVIGEAPGILTVEQASALLVNAPADVLPYFAIGLFAGLRRAEIERSDWAEIDFESNLIEVTAAKAKTAQRRFVTLQPNLRAWLLPLRQFKGNVTPPRDNFRQLFESARIAAGIVDWPENALRHSFASYHLAAFKNAASTALELGHHDSRVTFAHYRELVKPKEAARYWKLKPAGRTRKIVQMEAAR
jgi:integrase